MSKIIISKAEAEKAEPIVTIGDYAGDIYPKRVGKCVEIINVGDQSHIVIETGNGTAFDLRTYKSELRICSLPLKSGIMNTDYADDNHAGFIAIKKIPLDDY